MTNYQVAPYNLTDPQSGELIAAAGEPVTPVIFERWVSVAKSLRKVFTETSQGYTVVAYLDIWSGEGNGVMLSLLYDNESSEPLSVHEVGQQEVIYNPVEVQSV